MRVKWIAALVMLFMCTVAHAYPNQERASVDVDLSQSVQFVISSDNQSLYIAYANTFKIFDTGTFALAATQPYAISADTTKYPGNYAGIIYFSSANMIYLPMDNGIVLKFDLANVSAAPTIITLASGKKLGNGVADTVGGDAFYVINSTDTSVVKYKISTAAITAIPVLPAVSAAGFSVTPQLNQIIFSPQSSESASEVYITSTTNMLFYFNQGSLSPVLTLINPNLNLTDVLQGVSPMPAKNYVYVADYTANTFAQVQTSNHAVIGTPTSLTPNNNPNWLLITNVTNPTGVYGYVAGVQGVSIFDTSNNDIFDVGVTSVDNEPLPVSGIGPVLASTDGYVYISASSGNIGVLSDNPYVTVNSKTYSSGGSSLGVGGTVTINFKADETGTYVMRSGGNVSGNGTVLADNSGNSSGTVAVAGTAQDVVVPYNANASAFQEGANSVYFFVTDSASNVGRRATTVTVDTPPLAVTVVGSSFGNTRAYINFNRLTANDINHYNVYTDTDPVVVTTKSIASATVTQGSDATLTGTVSELTNGILYYMAIEGVDNAGNVGPRTSTFGGGALITSTPQFTVGPAGYTGETGCGLVEGAHRPISAILSALAVIVALGVAWLWRRSRRRTVVIALAMLTTSSVVAQDILMNPPSEPTLAPIKKYGWYLDGRASLWQPTSPTTKLFIPSFYNWQGYISGGFLFHEQIGAEVGVGIFYKTGAALSAGSAIPSQDKFRILTIPITIGGAYRFMYSRKMPVVPYVRGGFEMDYFRENDSGATIQGLKKGLYGGLGLQVPVSKWLDALDMEKHRDTQVYWIFEGLYKWMNDFGGRGLNLSGALYSTGFMVTF